MENQEEYWTKRYKEDRTGWDIGYVSTPIKEYVDQLTDKSLKILIPGAGNSYEAEYLWEQGFSNTHVLDISALPLQNIAKRVPDFPKGQLLQGDFFAHEGQYDLIFEQTFFCSFEPTKNNRNNYAKQMRNLLADTGKLVGLWFEHELTSDSKRPFGGSKEEYLGYLSPYFDAKVFDRCHNSIKPRQESELFAILKPK